MIAFALLLAAQQPQASTPVSEAMPIETLAPTRATEKLVELRALLEAGSCEKVIVASPYVADHRLATQAERHEAMFAHGYCLVVIGNISEAGTIFAAIVGENIAANPPFEVEPRVQFLIDAARSEAIKQRDAKAAAIRQAKLSRIRMEVSPPGTVTGGARAIFFVSVADPDAVVKSVRLDFRTKGEREFYALPVVLLSDGRWRAEIPGSYTRSQSGMTIEWFISSSDDEGERLTSEGSRDAPRALTISPGSVVALDLKANERLPQSGRIVLSLGAMPSVVAGSFVIAFVAINTLPLPSELQPWLFLSLGTVLATGGSYFVSSLLIDGLLAAAPSLVALTGAVLTTATFVGGGFADYQDWFATRGEANGGPIVGSIILALTTLAVTATSTTLVALDPPGE